MDLGPLAKPWFTGLYLKGDVPLVVFRASGDIGLAVKDYQDYGTTCDLQIEFSCGNSPS